MSEEFPDDMTLGEARAKLRKLVDKGYKCPCCGQRAQVYHRKIRGLQASALIKLWRAAGKEFAHIGEVGATAGAGGDFSKLRYWGLTEEMDGTREDGGRPGWWRVTDLGEDYLMERVGVAKYAHVYDGRLLGLHGPLLRIRDALGTKFNYDDLMNGV